MFDLVESIVGTNYRKILGRELYSGQPPVTVTDIQLRSSRLNLSLPKRTANMQSTANNVCAECAPNYKLNPSRIVGLVRVDE
jgi:hypothetical protein